MTRILVIEDDLGIFRSLEARLSAYDLLHANCQERAFRMLAETELDLVLLDLRLPVRPRDMVQNIQVGFDILRRIRDEGMTRRSSTEALPVIVMTAYGDEDVSTSAFTEYGANDYVKKPFKDLVAKIEAVLAGRPAVVPRSSAPLPRVQLALDDLEQRVLTNGILWDKPPHYELLRALADVLLADRAQLRLPKNYRGCSTAELATRWDVTENTVHRRVMRFRKEAVERLGGVDIIESTRGRGGYRLDPFRVEVVSWQELASELSSPAEPSD